MTYAVLTGGVSTKDRDRVIPQPDSKLPSEVVELPKPFSHPGWGEPLFAQEVEIKCDGHGSSSTFFPWGPGASTYLTNQVKRILWGWLGDESECFLSWQAPPAIQVLLEKLGAFTRSENFFSGEVLVYAKGGRFVGVVCFEHGAAPSATIPPKLRD